MTHPTVTLEEAREQAREAGLVEDEAIDEMDEYQIQAAQFRNRMHIDDADAQFKCLVEEVGELAEALNCEEDAGEEIADVLVTAFVLADIEEVDVRAEYIDKMEYNLGKTPSKRGGKVTDDG